MLCPGKRTSFAVFSIYSDTVIARSNASSDASSGTRHIGLVADLLGIYTDVMFAYIKAGRELSAFPGHASRHVQVCRTGRRQRLHANSEHDVDNHLSSCSAVITVFLPHFPIPSSSPSLLKWGVLLEAYVPCYMFQLFKAYVIFRATSCVLSTWLLLENVWWYLLVTGVDFIARSVFS